MFMDSFYQSSHNVAQQGLFASICASGPVKSGPNNKYGKNQCQGKGKGIYQGKPDGIIEKKQRENRDAQQKKCRPDGRQKTQMPIGYPQ